MCPTSSTQENVVLSNRRELPQRCLDLRSTHEWEIFGDPGSFGPMVFAGTLESPIEDEPWKEGTLFQRLRGFG